MTNKSTELRPKLFFEYNIVFKIITNPPLLYSTEEYRSEYQTLGIYNLHPVTVSHPFLSRFSIGNSILLDIYPINIF